MSEATGTVVSGDVDETARIATEFARHLQPGDLILVTGEVGVGKSTFVRSALRELGVEGPIPSPTFTIGRAYRGRVPAFHLDLYRLDLPGEEVPDLLGEYLDQSGVTFVEWPDRPMENLFDSPRRIGRVEIHHRDGDRREISLSHPVARPRSP